MKNNAGCTLPCWWGVIPGKTTWQEAEQFLTYLGLRIVSKFYPDEGIIYHGSSYNFSEPFLNRCGFVERKGIVDTIFAGAEGSTNPTAFQTIWERYSPTQVINDYKTPSRVLLRASGHIVGNTNKDGYILWIFYDQLGFMIRYDSSVITSPTYHICPNMDDTNIRMTMQSPSNPQPLEWDDSILTHDRNTVRTIEEATGLSLEEFYKRFTQPDQPGCFDTPRNIWPKK